MAITKTIEIDGKEVLFRASAAIPRLYRIKFGRDIYRDLATLEKTVDENDAGNSPEEWLEQFNTFSIYQVLPKIIELWGLNLQTDVTSKKNFAEQSGK